MFTMIPSLARSDTMSSSIALAVASPSFTMKSTVTWRHAEASFADSSHHTTPLVAMAIAMAMTVTFIVSLVGVFGFGFGFG